MSLKKREEERERHTLTIMQTDRQTHKRAGRPTEIDRPKILNMTYKPVTGDKLTPFSNKKPVYSG